MYIKAFYCEAKGNTLIVNVTVSKVLTSVNTPLVMSKVNTVSCLLSPKTIGAVGEVTLDLPLQYVNKNLSILYSVS